MTPTPYEFPIWVQYIEKLGAPIIAGIALLITFIYTRRQWRTAHEQRKIAQQRVVLDLFDRRMEVYDALRVVLGKIVRSGATTNEDVFELVRAKDRVSMLFGEEVITYTENLWEKVNNHAEQCTMESRTQGDALDEPG